MNIILSIYVFVSLFLFVAQKIKIEFFMAYMTNKGYDYEKMQMPLSDELLELIEAFTPYYNLYAFYSIMSWSFDDKEKECIETGLAVKNHGKN